MPLSKQTKFRSKFEADVIADLEAKQPTFEVAEHYEAVRLSYTVPAKTCRYTPDLYFADKHLAIELKGRFRDFDERTKYLHFVASNPDVTLKFVLQRPGVPIGPGSKTTQEDWLRAKGFEVAFGTVPMDWFDR